MSTPLKRDFAAPVLVAVVSRHKEETNQRRSISPQAGHALETLGHAIEYLADEFVHDPDSLCDHNPRLEAIQLLMARNREIYLACPTVPSLAERFRGFVRVLFSSTRP